MSVSIGKKGQHDFLHQILPRALDFVGVQWNGGQDIVIACQDGKDTSIGVALVLLQAFFDDHGSLHRSASFGLSLLFWDPTSSNFYGNRWSDEAIDSHATRVDHCCSARRKSIARDAEARQRLPAIRRVHT
jgi:hypothetical protein